MLEKVEINTFAEVAGKSVVAVYSEMGKTTHNKSKTVEIMTENMQRYSSKKPLKSQVRAQASEIYGQSTTKGARPFQGVTKEL